MNIIKPITKRIRAYQAKKLIEDTEGKLLLDIGCGDKYFINSFKKLSAQGIDKHYGQDVEKEALSEFQKSCFDYITMLAVVEHLKNHKKVLKECHEILKNEALLIMTTPFQKAEKFIQLYKKEVAKEHEVYFTKKDFENIEGFSLHHYSLFELGLNQLIALKKIEK
jgi:2-polyprenyl-3-methyl-5-hydroxy-6-metoxy-1,4-benzoquinol methylase